MLLAHEVAGPADAPPLVLVHGITESRHSWRPLIADLATDHRVLAVDLRGHGDSPAGDAYDPASYASDVIETATAAGMVRPIAIGHSLGGVVVSAMAAAGATAAVMNVDQSLRLSGFKAALAPLEPMLRDPAAFPGAIELLFQALDGALPDAERARLAGHNRADQAVVLGTWATVFDSTEAELDATVAGLAAAITVPYLSLHGADPGPDYPGWFTGLVPSATVEVWPGLGHYPHLVEPDRFLARIRQFLAAARQATN